MITMHQCQYCGREFEAKRRDASCCSSRECQNARWREWKTKGYNILGHPICGFIETDKRRINRRRRKVYARMQQFARLDGYRK